MSPRLRKIAVAAVISLLAFAFLSKSIVYWTTPKVMVADIKSGTIQYRNAITQCEIVSNDTQKVQTSILLPEGLPVTWVIKGEIRQVTMGEVLLRLEESTLDQRLASAENAYYASYVELNRYQKDYARAVESITKEYSDAQTALAKAVDVSETRRKTLQAARDTAYENYQVIVNMGIYEMTTVENKQSAYERASEQMNVLRALRDDGYAILAPCDGMLVNWPSQALGSLPVYDTLFELIPSDAAWDVQIRVQGAVYFENDYPWITLTNPQNALDRIKLSALSYKSNTASSVIVVSGTDLGMEKFNNMTQYELIYESPFYQALIPNHAFVSSDTVYVLYSNYLDNRKQMLVKSVKVETAPGNAMYTPVTRGISMETQVVTAWDRELTEGESVIVELR